MTKKQIIKIIFLLTLLIVSHASSVTTSCDSANQDQCGEGSCEHFHFLNGNCVPKVYQAVRPCPIVCNIDNCDVCLTTTTCQFCATDFILSQDSTQCNAPVCGIQKCLICQDPTKCTKCIDNYKPLLDQSGCQIICDTIIENCIQCNTITVTKCTACMQYYEPSLNGLSCNFQCDQKIQGCKICDTINTCQTCNSPRILVMPGRTQCSLTAPCIANCLSCDNTATCNQCNLDYIPSADKRSCLNVPPSLIQNCVDYETVSTCKQCLTNFLPLFPGKTQCSSISCTTSIPQCSKCLTTQTCSICNANYLLSSDSKKCNLDCPAVIFNCQICASQTQCTTCENRYLLNNPPNSCIPQCGIDKCITCASPTQCLICQTGYQPSITSSGSTCIQTTCQSGQIALSQSQCYSCSLLTENCKTCLFYNQQVICTSCNENLVLDSQRTCNSCDKIFNNCLRCKSGLGINGGTICVQCPTGYYLGNQYQCISCSLLSESCQTCKSGIVSRQPGICLSTSDGQVITAFGMVVTCSSLCQTCSSDPDYCTSCNIGYSLNEGVCIKCLVQNAQSCNPNEPIITTSCQPFNVINSTSGLCVACPKYCVSCNEIFNECDTLKCLVGYTLDSTGRCVNCFDNCPRCLAQDPRVCLECGTSRYKDGQFCIPCSTQCYNCMNATYCTQCNDGYSKYFNQSGIFCFMQSLYPCVSLNSDLLCSQCAVNFILNTVTNNCDFFVACNASKSCSDCPFGYYLFSSTCFQCNLTAHCKTCTNNQIQNNCRICNKQYYLSNGVCQPCMVGCKRCKNVNNCTSALSSYYLILDKKNEPTGYVGKCLSPCLTCQNHNIYCLTCIEGYVISGAFCISSKALNVRLVYTPVGYYDINDTEAEIINKTLAQLYDLKMMVCESLPDIITFDDDQICSKHLVLQNLQFGSILIDMRVNTQSFASPQQAQNAIIDNINDKGIGGSNAIATSIGSQGYRTEFTLNLGLILGVSIPIILLTILIIINVVYYCKRPQKIDEIKENNEVYESITQM